MSPTEVLQWFAVIAIIALVTAMIVIWIKMGWDIANS